MRKYKKLFKHDADAGIIGDCYRSSLACMLNLKPEEFPHIDASQLNADDFNKHFDNELRQRGLSSINLYYDGNLELKEILDFVGYMNPNLYYLLTGTSSNNNCHVVICKGNEIYWDTSETNSGIVGPCDDGFYYITFLTSTLFVDDNP